MDVRKISAIAIFIALSAVGAMIKIPSPIGSIALDSFPALLAAVILGPVSGAIVAGLGHIISAFIGGMTLGPFHFLIMVEMAVLTWLFSILYIKGKKVGAFFLFFISNAFVLALPFAFLISPGFYTLLVPGLTVATAVNIVLAVLLLPRLEPVLKKIIFKDGLAE
ncbi:MULTISPECIES: ECF transporter S component [unclassified Bacillus (in: firmicutes)]|uniref:ECF transporter S component n=1 Tax=unclassified Bacillus (in: firmicutes) TaxID=185979 RepID=UPI001BE7D0CC|nr:MULTISPECIES: ECF transporter S component [unclassified Bacillus (in: firmicutes)]MBT2614930.1 ECF transporter S component [Bacillus sp. ISL-78]MBT2627547.1 ECF transporter S component [Bacillus sp. ISL-101]MBT2717080.1 ECF transporter S component [Bacillus sp. ISL-57]